MNTELFPLLDLPSDVIAREDMPGETLRMYGGFPCRIRAALFVYCIEGSLSVKINLRDYVISQRDFVLLLPNSFVQVIQVSDHTRVSIISLSSSYVENSNILQPFFSSADTISNEPVVELSPDLREVYACAVSMIRQAILLSNDEMRNKIITNMIKSISDIVLPLFQQPVSPHRIHISRGDDIVQQFQALVMKYYTTEHRVGFYAEVLKISTPYLCAIINKQTGLTALQIINRAIISNAKSQLKSGNLPVKTIALSLGFDNTAFFSKFFRNQTGQTPMEYRHE